MKGKILFTASNRVQKECIKLIKAENPKLSNDLLQWNIIMDKVTTRLYDSKYFENKGNLDILIANNGSEKPVASKSIDGGLVVNPIMIKNLYIYNDIAVASFFSSIGHEIGHDSDCYLSIIHLVKYIPIYKLLKAKRIIWWTREVYADYYGCAKWIYADAELSVKCTNYKIENLTEKERNKKYIAYPSWNMRIEYIQRKKFDKELLYKIAYDVGCKKEKFLDKLIDDIYTHYCSKSPNYDVTNDVLLG